MRAFTLCLLGLSMFACGSSGAPTVTAVGTPEPATVTAGKKSEVTVQIGVTDEDGDLHSLRLGLRTPSNVVLQSGVDVRDQAGNARNSTIRLLLEVAPETAGTYTLEVVAIDAQDNESALASTELIATEP